MRASDNQSTSHGKGLPVVGFNIWTRGNVIKAGMPQQCARVIALDRVNQQIRIVARFLGDGVVRDVLPEQITGFEIEDARINILHRFKASELRTTDLSG